MANGEHQKRNLHPLNFRFELIDDGKLQNANIIRAKILTAKTLIKI